MVTILDFLGAKDDGGGGDNCSYKTCKAPVKSSTPANQQSAFYRPDVFPVAQPTVSKHWREQYRIPLTRSPHLFWVVFKPCLWPLKTPGYLGWRVAKPLNCKVLYVVLYPTPRVFHIERVVECSGSEMATSLWVRDIQDRAAEADATRCRLSRQWCCVAGAGQRGCWDDGLGSADQGVCDQSDVCVERLSAANRSQLCSLMPSDWRAHLQNNYAYLCLHVVNSILVVVCSLICFAPCRLRGCKNRPAPFAGRMSYKVPKPGLVCILYLIML